MWAENLPDLAATGRSIVAMDAVGDAGLSVQSTPLRSGADQASWVDETLTALGIARVHSVGHSFGGATAAAHALHHPARVASLTLLEPTFTLHWPPASVFFWATAAILPGPPQWRDHALAAIGGVSVADVRAETPISEMITAATEHYKAALPTPRPLPDQRLKALSMPTYVAIAEHKSLAGGEKAATRARLIPRAEVEVWPNTTHSLPMQVHAALADRLAQFWRGTRAAQDSAS